MSDIVWAVNPGKDRLIDLAQRMRRVAEDALSPRDVTLNFNAPDKTEDMKLDADKRRELFMIFKEAVNNVVRHSECTNVDIGFRVESGRLLLRVSDNGKGFDPQVATDGNGLSNIARRAEKLRGQLKITSNSSDGTIVQLDVPLGRYLTTRTSDSI